MGGLSLKFNERPSTRLLCCLYTNHTHFLLFLRGLIWLAFGSFCLLDDKREWLMLRAFVGVNCQRHRFALVLNLDEAVMESGNSDPEMYITQSSPQRKRTFPTLDVLCEDTLDRFRSRTSTSKTTWKWRNQTTDFYFRFNLERQICLFPRVFVFSSRLFISLDISISCQYIGKEKLSKTGLVFPKIVSEQSWSFKGINSEYFVVLKRWTSSHFSGKNKSCR